MYTTAFLTVFFFAVRASALSSIEGGPVFFLIHSTIVSSVRPPLYSVGTPPLKIQNVRLRKRVIFSLVAINFYLPEELKSWETLYVKSGSEFVVHSCINLGKILRWVQCSKLLSSLNILWGKFLAVTTKNC
jgi:hypothetical protein